MNIFDLLVQAILKQKELYKDPQWQVELLPYASPVLWFGDLESNLSKIVSIGANPSRREFLNSATADTNNYQNYLHRFYLFDSPIYELNNISDETLEGITNSYNNYFSNQPYRTWFGRLNGGKVEALMNGLGGSFYNNDLIFRSIHIDLFPFATISNFTEIYELCNDTLFQNKWAQNFLTELVLRIYPEKLIVFGISNYNNFCNIFNLPDVLPTVVNINSCTCNLYFNHLNLNDLIFPIIGLSINLGNPRGWSTNNLNQLGEFIKNH
jgi:hypothetical protein